MAVTMKYVSGTVGYVCHYEKAGSVKLIGFGDSDLRVIWMIERAPRASSFILGKASVEHFAPSIYAVDRVLHP